MPPAVWRLLLLICLVFLFLEFHALWRHDWVPAVALRLLEWALLGALRYLRALAGAQYGQRHPRALTLDDAVHWLLWQDACFFGLVALLLVGARLYCLVWVACTLLCLYWIRPATEPRDIHVIV